MKFKFVTSFLLLVLIYNLVYINESHAEGLSLGISPPLIKITAKPPSLISTPIIIQNLSDTTQRLSVSLEPFRPKDTSDGSAEYFSEEEKKTLLKDSFYTTTKVMYENEEIKEMELGPKQEKTVILSLDINQETIKDYYFSIVFISKPVTTSGSNSDTQTTAGIATNVIVSLGQAQKPKGHLSEFSVPSFVESGPLPFTVQVENTGEHVFTPKGNIVITNMFGQKIGKVNLREVNVLQDSGRYIPSKESLNTTAVWDENFLFGFYTAQIALDLSSQGPHFEKTVWFVAFPLKLALGIVVVLYLFFIIRARVQRKLK